MANYDSISRNIGVSAVTIKNRCSILEASYIIHFLEPDSNNLGRTVVKTPKLYFVDSGLMCHLLRLESKEGRGYCRGFERISDDIGVVLDNEG